MLTCPRDRRRAILACLAASYALVLAAAACNNTLQGTLNLITGPDDGFAQDPKPTLLRVATVSASGSTSTLGTVKLPTDAGLSLSLDATTLAALQVTGFDDADAAVVSGQSVPLSFGQLGGGTLNLFVQRTGQFSRLPSADGGTALLPSSVSPRPLLTTFAEFMLIADGTGKSANTQAYDTFVWQVYPAPPPLPVAPLSLAYVDTFTSSDAGPEAGTVAALLSIGADASAAWLDLTDSTSIDAEVVQPATVGKSALGFSLRDVAGGQTILGTGGAAFIVGATRTSGSPTKAVLRISATGALTWASLGTARLGAAAAYLASTSGGAGALYVFGGEARPDSDAAAVDASKDAAPTAMTGVEYLSDGVDMAMVAGPSLPPDTTTGAGAVAIDTTDGAQTLLVAGGALADGTAAPVRFYFTTADAGATTWPSLPVTLVTAQLFALTPSPNPSAIVVGSEKSGASSAYILTPTHVTRVPFKVGRTNVQAIVLPNGSLGIVGGDSGTLESFIP